MSNKILIQVYTGTDCYVMTFAQMNIVCYMMNHIDGVMVGVFTVSVIDCGYEPRSGQTKDYEIGICCFFAKHAALRRKQRLIG